jgi:hypothetical protein
VQTVFARVASFEGGDMERMRELSEPQIESGTMEFPPGTKKVMVLADSERNRRQFVTFFESREAVEAAEERFESMGAEIAEDVRGRRTAVDVYEVVWERDF